MGHELTRLSAGPDEGRLWDAYSEAVTGAVDRVGPATVLIEARDDRQAGGRGSGFLFTPDGFALTNSHVVHGAHALRAVLTDGQAFDADVIGDDPETDVAVIKVASPSVLPSASVGASRALRVGDMVVSLDDQAVQGVDDLHRMLTEARVGVPVRVCVVRGPDLLPFILVPEESPKDA